MNHDAIEPDEVYAIRYASMPRRRADNFIGGDPHDGPMPMDFFVWLLKSPTRSILVDTGFSAETAARRDRQFLRCPVEALRALGVAPDDVHDVVLTHLRYDHAGNLPKLASARFHVQDAELDYATGRCMCHAPCAMPTRWTTWSNSCARSMRTAWCSTPAVRSWRRASSCC